MDQNHYNLYISIQKLVDHTRLHTVGACQNHFFFQRLQSYLWLAMVNIESFTHNTFIVIHIQILKPIFHCDAKPFALGTFVSPNAKDSTFALPNAKNTNMLVSLALVDANISRYLTQNPQRVSVEYRLCWAPNAKLLRWPCTFHVFCVDFICVWCPTQTQFPVEYGLKGLIDKSMLDFLQCKKNQIFPIETHGKH